MVEHANQKNGKNKVQRNVWLMLVQDIGFESIEKSEILPKRNRLPMMIPQ